MPELPEVEVARRSFARRIEGGRITGVRLGKPLRWGLGCDAAELVDQTVAGVSRRGKYIWMELQPHPAADAPNESGAGLLIHLGMSGSLAFSDRVDGHGAHDHFDLHTSLGTLRLTDPRRFGAVVWSASRSTGMAAKLLDHLGIEPFDSAFDGAYLHAALQKRRVAIKLVLLGGDIVVGAGNIYACEALFLAGIDPRLPAQRISRPRAARLAAAIPFVLNQALDLGGSTLRDFRDAHGGAGAFQIHARVYGRAGLPCTVCGTPIRRIVQAQRATYFCPTCQRR